MSVRFVPSPAYSGFYVIYQTRDIRISKHREENLKYGTQRSIFEVFGEADETLSRVFDTYTLFDGLTHTDARIFCELRSILKIRAMRKMSARIIC